MAWWTAFASRNEAVLWLLKVNSWGRLSFCYEQLYSWFRWNTTCLCRRFLFLFWLLKGFLDCQMFDTPGSKNWWFIELIFDNHVQLVRLSSSRTTPSCVGLLQDLPALMVNLSRVLYIVPWSVTIPWLFKEAKSLTFQGICLMTFFISSIPSGNHVEGSAGTEEKWSSDPFWCVWNSSGIAEGGHNAKYWW